MSMPRRLTALFVAAAATACASSGATPRPFPTPTPSPGSDPGAARPVTSPSSAPRAAVGGVGAGYAVAGTALSFRGAPYRNGGSDPSGFDCSGFVWYVFGQHGITVPRTVGEQYRQGTDVSRSTLEAGDLVFFDTGCSGASHVGMVIGGDEFVHAPSSRGEVRVERMSSQYWASRYVGARRLW